MCWLLNWDLFKLNSPEVAWMVFWLQRLISANWCKNLKLKNVSFQVQFCICIPSTCSVLEHTYFMNTLTMFQNISITFFLSLIFTNVRRVIFGLVSMGFTMEKTQCRDAVTKVRNSIYVLTFHLAYLPCVFFLWVWLCQIPRSSLSVSNISFLSHLFFNRYLYLS